MVDQVKITRIADTVETMVNAVMTSGTMNSTSTPTSISSVVNARLSSGTLLLDSRRNRPGALSWLASPKSMRLDENTPLLAEEAAEVRTTKLTIPAAAGNPATRNSSTKGLLTGETCCHEVTAIMQVSAST